jgi:M6 family metalloprotease-like protein
MRIMRPPRSRFAKRRRILTEAHQAVNSAGPKGSILAGCLLALLTVGAAAPPERVVPTRGELRLLAIRASFADRPLLEPREHFAGTPESLLDRLVAYYAEVSTGRLRIVPHLAETAVALPQSRARYVQRPVALASEAITAFERTLQSDADRRAFADAHAVVVLFPGPGRESYLQPGKTDDPWSNYAHLATPLAGFRGAIVLASTQYEQLSSFGVLCHEFGHLLGLPELYAPGGARHEGIGKWGLMGQGTWVGRGTSPPHLEAWSKVTLGWADVTTIDETTVGVRLPAVTDEPLVVKIPAVPGKPEEYYLLENRQLAGYDAKLPGAGILVWHVDETVRGFRTAQSRPEHKLLHLVEADGRGDLDRGERNGGNRGDAGDPWSGPPRRRRVAGALLGLMGAIFVALALYRLTRGRQVALVLLTAAVGAGALWLGAWLRRSPVCGPGTPGMAPYGAQPTRVVLRRFSPSAPVMHVDVLVAPSGQPAAPPP